MVTLRILKRKDAASVVVAVVLGFVVYAFLSSVAEPLARELSGNSVTATGDWHDQYLYPTVLALLEIVFLEVFAWAYVWVIARV
jgi:hypothetical protein